MAAAGPTPSTTAASFRPPPPPCFDYREAMLPHTRAAAAADPSLAALVESGALVRVPRRRFGPVPAWRPPEFVEPEEVWILGTSHLSDESVADVERVLRAVRPDNVVVDPNSSEPSIGASIWVGRLHLLCVCFWPFSPQRFLPVQIDHLEKSSERLGRCLKILALNSFLGILERAWKSLSWDEKTKLLVSLFRGITSTTETAQDEKAAGSPYDLYEKLSISYPSLLQPLIHERDMFLAWSLKRSKAVNKSKTVVGIIGKGHMNGVVYALISDQGDLRFRDLVGRASSDTWASSLIKGLPRHVTQRVRHVVEANRLLRADLLPLSVSAIAVNFLSLSTTRFICHPNSKLTATIADNLDHIAADFFKTNTWGRL
uniref:TraB domain-containing protein n=1 Tax=Leersia perrieri TaxID=77586 RepID=A0A0D9XAG5_9ORYZ